MRNTHARFGVVNTDGSNARLFWLATIAFGLPASMHAQAVIADPDADVSFRPDVWQAENGATVVDITDPRAGVSLNAYDAFNVDSRGLVLNNSTSASSTRIAGQVRGNARLQSGPASVIVNQVNGSSGSSLNGAIEVAGQRADVIVASPNGISCDGCTFINSNAVTLTTGTPVAGLGGGLVYEVGAGSIVIGQRGLSGDGSVRLAGKAVRIDGAVAAADKLQISGGTQRLDAQTGEVSGEGAAGETYAVDGTALGVLKAGQVTVIGNDRGLGVRLLGAVQSDAGDVSIVSAGDLFARSIGSAASVNLKAAGTLTLERDVSARRLLTVRSDIGDVVVGERGGLYAGEALSVSAARDVDVAGDLQAGRGASFAAGRDIRSAVTGVTSGTFSLDAGRNADITAGRIAGAELAIRAAETARIGDAHLVAGTNVSVDARTVSLGEGAAFAGTNVTLTAREDLESAAVLNGYDGILTLDIGRDLRILERGVFAWNQINLTLQGALDNAGTLFSRLTARLKPQVFSIA